jgi:hypothetical protein
MQRFHCRQRIAHRRVAGEAGLREQAPAGRDTQRVQPYREEPDCGSFHAVGCLVHFVSLIVSSHWNFTARTFPIIGKPRRSRAGDRAVDSNSIRFPLARGICFLFSGLPPMPNQFLNLET